MNNGKKEYISEDKSFTFLDRKLWLRLGAMLRQHTVSAFVILLALLAAELLPQFQPRFLMQLVDGPIKSHDMDGVAPLCLAFLAVVLISGLLKYITYVFSQAMALKIIHVLRMDLFAKVQKYKIDFFKRTPVGRLMTRLTSDIDSISTMFSDGLVDLAGALLMMIYPVVFMLILNWKLALVTLSVVPVMMIATSVFRIKVRAINTKIRSHIAELNTLMQESLSGNHIVQMFGKVRQQWTLFDKVNADLKNSWLQNVFYYAVYFPVIGGVTDLSIILMCFAGGVLFFRDQATIGTLMAFSWYMGMFWRPLREVSDRYTQLQSALAAAERVFTLLDLNEIIPMGTVQRKKGPVEIRFDEVCFSYGDDEPALKKISFTLEEGETLAVVGATGSGKSTLIALCNGFYVPDSGAVLINGVPLQGYKEGFLQRHISYIPQDVYLFAETIAFNIALSDDIDKQKLEEVCRYVNAHTFISRLKDGCYSRITERGENLSTGQRQLIAFARAIYHDPQILLLDEATSAVDTETEALILDAMEKLTRDMTSIVVAHRLSTVKSADRILVMHKGEIREQGTHESLISQKGIYQKLHALSAAVPETRFKI